MVTGNETMTCRAGTFNTLYTSSSKPKICDAARKRDIIASNGFSLSSRGAGSRYAIKLVKKLLLFYYWKNAFAMI
jgi:hypothetical protein